jgi:uncharacterized membrane protein
MLVSFNKPVFLILILLTPVIWVMINRSSLKGSRLKHKLILGGGRALLFIILVLVLSDPRTMAPSDRVNLFFCLDLSESVGDEEKTAVEEYMQKVSAVMQAEDQAGLIIFGKYPSLEVPLRKKFNTPIIRSYVNRDYTNIYGALQLAIGKFPKKGKNKIVLFSDGNENIGNSIQMAYLARSLGIEIYPVPLNSWFDKGEIFINKLDTPSTVPLETPFEIRIVIMSSKDIQSELVLFRSEKLLISRSVQLKSGKNVLTFVDMVSEAGLYLYKAVINASEDIFFQNNTGLSFTRGTRKAQILYLTGEDPIAAPFVDTLKIQGLDLVHKNVRDLAGTVHGLLDYNAVILDNVSGESLSFTAMENIETYVKDMGGGLIMMGGDNSFGAGYYKNTPIEKALPVFMDAPADLKFSDLCLIFVIDKSMSMTSGADDTAKNKLEMAKIAAFASIQMLNPTDRVGVVVFDTEFKWIIPLMKAKERRWIANKLSQVEGDGGTDLFPALSNVFRSIKQAKAAKKHVIVLSDGETKKADFKTLVKSMSQSAISVSTVAIGDDADIELMKSIAAWGQGRSYYTDNSKNIPKIFTGETKIVTKNLVIEKILQPYSTRPNEMMQGIKAGQLPVIHGQVLTHPKPGAGVWIRTAEGPLLTAWRYGLGRSVAFTSDLSGRWGRDWVRWEHYGRFTSQMVKWAQKKETQKKFFATIDRDGENGKFTVDLFSEENRFINNSDLRVNVRFPSQKSKTISLDQIAPGRYQCAFLAEEIGEYYFSLFGRKNDQSSFQQVFGFGIPYTDEFYNLGVRLSLLQSLAAMTNGKLLSIDRGRNDLFSTKAGAKDYGRPLWPYLLLAFLLFLIIDVGARKLLNLS